MEHLATLLNTLGARRWLWNYIQENGHDKDYQVIQDIYQLTSDVLREAKENGLISGDIDRLDKRLGPNSFHYQTKKGFAFVHDSLLMTPFGEIRIYNEFFFKGGISTISVTQELIQRLNAVFEKRIGKPAGEIFEINISDTNKCRKISNTKKSRKISKEEMNKITEEDLENKKGTQNLIVDSKYRNLGVYHIREINGEKLSNLICYDSEESILSWETVNRMWEMLEANKLNEDPIKLKIIQGNMQALSLDTQEPAFKSISEVSEWAVELVEKLDQQPFIIRKPSQKMPIKRMVINKQSEVLVLIILNDAAKKFLENQTNWVIRSCYCKPKKGKDVGPGIELQIRKGCQLCDIHTLKKAIDLVINDVTQHWMKSNLKDYPAILLPQSEEEYVLLIKKEPSFPEEELIIRYLSDLLGLSRSIECHSAWKGEASDGLYLWIKREGLEKTLEILNITAL
jgi:hypothetical protein